MHELGIEPTAAAIAGSVARGDADGASDIDLISYIDHSLSQVVAERSDAISRRHEGERLFFAVEQGLAFYGMFEGVKCDFSISPGTQVVTLVEDVIKRHDTTPDKHTVISGIREFLPIHGDAFIAELKRRTDTYPDGLALSIIRENILLPPRWVIERMGLGRRDFFLTQELLTTAVRRMLALCCARNRHYFNYKLKAIDRLVRELEATPPDFHSRLAGLLTDRDSSLADRYASLASDCWELVEASPFDVSTTLARARFERSFGPA